MAQIKLKQKIESLAGSKTYKTSDFAGDIDNNFNELYQDVSNLEGQLNLRKDTLKYDELTEEWITTDNFFTADVISQCKIAVVDENNNVKYYLDSNDPRFKENGEPANIYGYTVDTIKNINGNDYTILASDFGQVKVEIPKFYYSKKKVSNIHTIEMSKYYFLGGVIHPAFRRYSAVEEKVVDVDFAYIGRYEGVLFDTDKNRCVNGVYIDNTISADATTKTITFETATQYLQPGDVLKDISGVLGSVNAVYTIASVVLDANKFTTQVIVNEAILDVASGTSISLRNDIDLAADKLMSVSGYKPLTYISQIDARALASNYSTKQSQQTYADWFLIQLLAAVKFQTLNIQAALGVGKTTSTGLYKYVSVTGLSDATGMADWVDNTANLQFAGGASIFGIENPYGNIWKWMDGMNINDWLVSLSVDNSQFDNASSYENTGIELPHANGYWGKIINSERGIFPGSNDGDSANGIGDYYYQASGARVGLVGGALHYGTYAGLSSLPVNNSASNRHWTFGARVRS